MGVPRAWSADSRCHLDEKVAGVAHMGAFPASDGVVGAALFTLFPFDRWRGFSTPATFAGVPEAAAAPEQPVGAVGGAPVSGVGTNYNVLVRLVAPGMGR